MTAKKNVKSTKKVAKKLSTASKNVLPLNKKNAVKFGDQLYSNKGGIIQCIALCDGTLQNGKVGGRTTHCAVGEVFHVFVNPSLSRVLNKEDATDSAIQAIANVAKRRDSSEEGLEILVDALHELVEANDSDGVQRDLRDAATYVERAEEVQRAWRTHIIPLLK
jgi:hypothetical protein